MQGGRKKEREREETGLRGGRIGRVEERKREKGRGEVEELTGRCIMLFYDPEAR